MGMVMLLFLILHLLDFFAFKIGAKTLPFPAIDLGNGEFMDNLFAQVQHEFRDEISHVIMYPIFMIAVGFHLFHGFQSAFQSLGLNHKKYTPFIKSLGTAYSRAFCFDSNFDLPRGNIRLIRTF